MSLNRSVLSANSSAMAAFSYIKFLLLSAIAFALVYPLAFLILVPALFYRSFIRLLVKIFDPKCGPILSPLDACYASYDPYDSPVITINPYFTFSSKVERGNIVDTLKKKIIIPKLFPELQQKLVRRFGFYFHYPVENFDVADHVRYLFPDNPNKPIKLTELRKYSSEHLSPAPFDSNKSPWELVLVPNLFDENNPAVRSAIFLRVQHCLMDGYSIQNFIKKVATKPWDVYMPTRSAEKNKQSHFLRKLQQQIYYLRLILTGPYYALEMFQFQNEKNDFLEKVLAESKSSTLVWDMREKEPERFERSTLKKIQNQYKVGVTHILLTLLSQAIFKFIKRKCIQMGIKIPKQIYLFMSFPLPHHPDQLTNHWTAVKFPLTVNQDDEAVKTLMEVQSHCDILKTSVRPLVAFGVSQALGILPVWFHPKPDNFPKQSICVGNLPGPLEKVDLFGLKVEGYCATGNPAKGSGFVVFCHTMTGKFWIELGGVKPIFENQQELDLLQSYIHETLAGLEVQKEIP